MATDKVGNQSSDMSDAAFTIFAVDTTAPKTAVTDPAAGAWIDRRQAGEGVRQRSGIRHRAGDVLRRPRRVASPSSPWTPRHPTSRHWDTTGYQRRCQARVVAKNGVGMVTDVGGRARSTSTTPRPPSTLTQPAERRHRVSGTAYEFISASSRQRLGRRLGDVRGAGVLQRRVRPNSARQRPRRSSSPSTPRPCPMARTASAATATDKVGLTSGMDVEAGPT